MALVPMKDQSDVEFVRQDTPHRHVGEPVITLVLTPAGGVGLGPIALAVDLLGRAPQALDLDVGLANQPHELLLGPVDSGDAGILGVYVIAQDLPTVLETLLGPPLGFLLRSSRNRLRSN